MSYISSSFILLTLSQTGIFVSTITAFVAVSLREKLHYTRRHLVNTFSPHRKLTRCSKNLFTKKYSITCCFYDKIIYLCLLVVSTNFSLPFTCHIYAFNFLTLQCGTKGVNHGLQTIAQSDFKIDEIIYFYVSQIIESMRSASKTLICFQLCSRHRPCRTW